MGTKKTLYVSDDDDAVWKAAQQAGAGDEGSLSKLVTAALSDYLGSRVPLDDEKALLADAEQRVSDRALVARVRALVRRHGVNDVSWAFGRALIKEGASRSRAAAKAHATLGPERREAAARKAATAKGVQGQQLAARKAWATRKVREKG